MIHRSLHVIVFLYCCSLGLASLLQKKFLVDTSDIALSECVHCLCTHRCLVGELEERYCREHVHKINCNSPGCGDYPCSGHGFCYKIEDDPSQCFCDVGFDGDHCEHNVTLDFCASNPCVHGQCTNDGIGHKCACNTGWSGYNCDIDNTPVNHCAGNPCVHGNCTSDANGYLCACLNGWIGDNCETYLFTPSPNCASNPCVHGTCTSDASGYHCACASGWSGKNCDTDIKECSSNPCKNNGTCLEFGGFFACACADGWSGTTCEKDATPGCKHLCVLESVAKVQPVINNLSLKCNNTNIGSNEAIPMTCCGLGRQDTWLKGIKVMEHCSGSSAMQTYTPIASFQSGRPLVDTPGVFLSCEANGFKYIRQTCDKPPHIITVDTTNSMNPSLFYVIY